MKIAIHHTPGSFSDRWITYCEKNMIDYKLVNAYENDIIDQLKECQAFFWNHLSHKYKDAIFAKQLLISLETAGIKVFPNYKTTWHYDDKVGQKYLLEALGVDFVKTYVFYTKKEALDWARSTTFPKVFKLSGGAASNNVRLVKSYNEASKLIHRAFTSGFKQSNKKNTLKERYHTYKLKNKSILWLVKGLYYLFWQDEFTKMHPREKGYVYFQNFIPDNLFDIRIIVIGEKAFAIKRMNRTNDFRASGSGNIHYKRHEIDERCVQIAFNVNEIINSQCIAYDFVFDANNEPLILEISYGYLPSVYQDCEGYWDTALQWHQESIEPQKWVIENLIQSKVK